MNELEEILELLGADQMEIIKMELFQLITDCLNSQHFQVDIYKRTEPSNRLEPRTSNLEPRTSNFEPRTSPPPLALPSPLAPHLSHLSHLTITRVCVL